MARNRFINKGNGLIVHLDLDMVGDDIADLVVLDQLDMFEIESL